MGKATKASSGTEGNQKAPQSATKASKSKAVVTAGTKAPVSGGLLSAFRPAPRCIFMPLFVGLCLWTVAMHDQCDVKGKKKDCGYSGISQGACKTVACFLKGGTGFVTRKIKVDVEQDASLGLAAKSDGGTLRVAAVQEGAVQLHNEKADAEDMLVPGDELQRVGGDGRTATKPKDIEKALERKGTGKAVEFVVRRSRLHSSLQWLHSKTSTPNWAEKILSSPGTQHFGQVWSGLAGIGLSTWFISGYGAASLPMYGFLSAATAMELTRCCHNEQVGGGVPHCYRSKRDPLGEVLRNALQRSNSTAKRAANMGFVKQLVSPKPLSL